MYERLSSRVVWAWLATACVPPTEPAPWTPEREWVAVTTYPCAVDSQGAVMCWTPGIEPRPIAVDDFEDHEAMQSLAPLGTDRVLTGLTLDGRVDEVYCPNNANTGVRPWRCEVDWEGVFSDFNGAVALTGDGTVAIVADPVVWDEQRWVAISNGPLALNARHELAMPNRQAPVHGPLSLRSVPQTVVSSSIYRDDASSYLGGCVLEEQGRVVCVGDGPYWTESIFHEMDGVKELSGGNGTVCAQLEDDRILCHDGQIFDFGALNSFDAFSNQTGWRFEEDPRYLQEPTVCAITTANTIVCEGARVDDVLEEQLAEVNRRYGDPSAL